MNRTLLAAAILTAALAVTGCYEPTRITVVNELGSWNIEYIYISGTDEEDWGLSSIPSGTIVTPGDSILIGVEPGRYDLQVVDEDGDTYTRWDQEVPAEGYRWEVTLGEID